MQLRKYLKIKISASILALVVSTLSAQSGSVNVSAQTNIFGAGVGFPPGGGVTPPFLSFPAGAGKVITFPIVSGNITNGGPLNIYPPDGVICSSTCNSNFNAQGGISGLIGGSALFLTGVFLTNSPATPPAPPPLISGSSFTDLSPGIAQTFFIGDGLTGTGVGQVQKFHVPPTATRLFLGFADGNNFQGNPTFYDDNSGALNVQYNISSISLAIPSGLPGGNQQTGNVGQPLTSPLVVKTTNSDGSPASGISISFSISQQPAGATGAALTNTSATTGAGGTASTQLTLGDKPGQYQVTASCSGCISAILTETAALNVNITMSAFIQSETVDGPGSRYAPIANAAPPVQQLSWGLLGAAAGITCGVPGLYGSDIEALRYSGNNRSFDPAGTSYKIKEQWTLNSDDSLYPTGLAGSPSQLRVLSQSWAPNSFSDGLLTPQAKEATTPSPGPLCNLLFAQALPNLSLTPMPTVTRTATSIKSHFQVQVGDPLIVNSNKLNSLVPNLLDYASPLRADLTLTIDLTANTFELSGIHTCYPAFEVYLNNTPIYTFTPTADRFITIVSCLALRAFPLNVDMFGQVPLP